MAASSRQTRRQQGPSGLKLLVDNGEEIVATILLVAALCVMAAQVVLRYGFDSPLAWAEEVSAIMLVWLSLLGSVGALKRAQHLQVDVLVDHLPERWRRGSRWLVFGLSQLLFVILLVQATELALATRQTALSVPVSWRYVYGAASVFSVLASIRLIQQEVFHYEFSFIAGSVEETLETLKAAS